MREEVACLIKEHAPDSARILWDEDDHGLFGKDGYCAIQFVTQEDHSATMSKVRFALGELAVDPEHDGDPIGLMKELSQLSPNLTHIMDVVPKVLMT